MTNLAEIVLFHLRHNGDIYLAHWYLIVLVIWLVLAFVVGFVHGYTKKDR